MYFPCQKEAEVIEMAQIFGFAPLLEYAAPVRRRGAGRVADMAAGTAHMIAAVVVRMAAVGKIVVGMAVDMAADMAVDTAHMAVIAVSSVALG